MGVNIDELVDTHFDEFMDFLYAEINSNLVIDSGLVNRYFNDVAGIQLDKVVLDSVSEKFIELIIDDGNPNLDEYDEDTPEDYESSD